MTITITAFARSPDGGQGLAHDMRIRWALEEVAQPYAVRLVSFHAMREPAHLAPHPFGQIPTCEEAVLVLFETGAILLHIAGRLAGLLDEFAMLAANVARGEARPACRRAFAAQRAINAVDPGTASRPQHG